MPHYIRTFLVVLSLLLISAVGVSAAGAPPLTQIAPVALWAEETSPIPAETSYPNRLPEGIVFRGTRLYIKARFIGYPAWSTLAYRSGTETGRELDYWEVARTPLTDSSRIIIGYEQTVRIPFAELGAGETDLCITAHDTNSGVPQYAYIRGIRTEKTAQ